MSRLPRGFWGLAVGCGALMTACVGAGDVTVVNSEDQLRTSEIQAVLSALSEAFGAVDVTANSPEAGLQLAPVPVNTTFDASVPCEAGIISVSGTANGTLDDETLEGDLTLQLSWNFVGCVMTSDFGPITLDGSPSIQFAAQYLFSQEQFAVTATESGGFDFATADGRAGVCSIDLSMGMSYDDATAESTETVTGWVCGRPAEEFAAFLL